MKKVIVLSLGLCVLAAGGCKKKNPLNPLNAVACASDYEKVAVALNKWANDPTEANCQAYKKSIVDFVKKCPAYYPDGDMKELEEQSKEPCYTD